jgi:hypothetical protein
MGEDLETVRVDMFAKRPIGISSTEKKNRLRAKVEKHTSMFSVQDDKRFLNVYKAEIESLPRLGWKPREDSWSDRKLS